MSEARIFPVKRKGGREGEREEGREGGIEWKMAYDTYIM